MPTSRLRVAREPALALIVRIFVGSVAERWDVPEPAREDLRLAASDLFSGAVEAGGGDLVTFELSTDDTEIELRAEDVRSPAEGTTDLEGSMGRFDLVRVLFPDAEIGETVRIRVPSLT
jgi:anti-sigma regulatory factor (Ser/Thr protein kinase)